VFIWALRFLCIYKHFFKRRVDNEIRAIIHNQTETSDIGKASLEDAQKAIIHLFSQIKDIKYKAEKSEEMVNLRSNSQFSYILNIIHIEIYENKGERNNKRYKELGHCKEEFDSINNHFK